MPCPAEHDLVRAHQLGDDDFVDHIADCARCREAWNGFDRIIELARELPVEIPSTAHREEVRTALLASPEPAPRRSRWVLLAPAAAVVAVAAGVSIWIVSRPPDEPTQVASRASLAPLATVHASAHADYTTESRELVRLRSGTLTLEVEPLHIGERFRVIVGDGEVEVRGTAFEVTATSDHLIAVRVAHGRVEVRPVGAAITVLEPGQSWHVPIIAVTPAPVPAPVAPAPPPVPAPAPVRRRVIAKAPAKSDTPAHVDVGPPVPAPAPTPTKLAPSPDEIAYNEAWDAMRTGNFRAAAAAFTRVRSGALVDEASFWHAVSLARGGHADEAIIAFRATIQQFPSSPRAGEASAMLGWLLVDARQLDEARSRFSSASNDRSDAVRDSAKRGLDALKQH